MTKKKYSYPSKSVPSTHEKSRVDKQEAIRLRMLGYTYAQIAGMLGCSEIWCRKSLVGITKGIQCGDDEKILYLSNIIAIKKLEDIITQLRKENMKFSEIQENISVIS